MKDFQSAAQQLSPDVIERFREALATGRWPDGNQLSQQQREIVMQAVILYENEHCEPGQRTAEMEDACASKTGASIDKDSDGESEAITLDQLKPSSGSLH